jgi:hypothetical protein
MAATQYLPIAEVAKVQNFVQFSSTVSALQTALNGAFSSAGNVQCMADTTAGQTSNALVIVNDNIVFSVPPNNWVGWNNGAWAQYTPAQMTANFVQYFTS